MKRSLAQAALGLTGAALAAALVATLLLSHAARPVAHGGISTAASAVDTSSPSPSTTTVVVASSPTPTPSTLTTTTTQPAPAPAPPSQVATVQNPLPSPTPTPTPTPTPSPVQVQPSPTPTPTPAPTPPPVCSWTVAVSTLAGPTSADGWANLGTWTGNTQTSTSPIFITSQYGWLQYTYQFTDACIGHATLKSVYTLSGSPILSDSITSTASSTRQANVPNNQQVDFVVTIA